MSIIDKIVKVDFPNTQYVVEETVKNQIILHHTVSGDGVQGDIAWWKSTPERVATHFVIGREGTIYQNYNTRYWAYHLGLSNASFSKFDLLYKNLDKSSIGIEIDSWGYLTRKNDKFYSAGNTVVPLEKVQIYDAPFRGQLYYEKYTNAQIDILKELLIYLRDNKSKELVIYRKEMFDISKDALRGVNGIWSHVSYRSDKSDCHPQSELIEMLKSL